MRSTTGYFEIGITGNKCPANLGSLWRSAFLYGAKGVFSIGSRYPVSRLPSDTPQTWRHVPLRVYPDFASLVIPVGAQLIGVEIGGKPLKEFHHPESAIYLLGAEDHGIPKAELARCDSIVSIESMRAESLNVAVAGSIIMYHRFQRISS